MKQNSIINYSKVNDVAVLHLHHWIYPHLLHHHLLCCPWTKAGCSASSTKEKVIGCPYKITWDRQGRVLLTLSTLDMNCLSPSSSIYMMHLSISPIYGLFMYFNFCYNICAYDYRTNCLFACKPILILSYGLT